MNIKFIGFLLSVVFLACSVNVSAGLISESELIKSSEIAELNTPDAKFILTELEAQQGSIDQLAFTDAGNQGADDGYGQSTGCSVGCSVGCSIGCY